MDDTLSKKFYRIGDVAEILEIPQSTLRFWEKEFAELRPKRNTGQRRLYTPNDIELLRVIRFLLKDKGLTLDGAREHLRRNRRTVDHRHAVITRLQAARNTLQSLLDALDHRPRKSS